MAAKRIFDREVSALAAVLSALSPLEKEGQEWVLASVGSRLGLKATGALPPAGDGGSGSDVGRAARGGGGDGQQSPKEFMRAKNPQTDVQRVTCLAHYLTHSRSIPHFKTKDLTGLNTEAARPTIGNAAQAVANATNQSGYLAAAGKGKKQITALGEDVVAALPDQAAVKELEAGQRPKRRKSPSRKASRRA